MFYNLLLTTNMFDQFYYHQGSLYYKCSNCPTV